MRKPDPLWQRIAFVVGAALFLAVGKFVGWNLSWLPMGFPTQEVVISKFLNWMQIVPAVAACIWAYMRLRAGQTTARPSWMLGALVVPVSLVSGFYSFLVLEKTAALMQTRIILLVALSVWSLFSLWVTGHFKRTVRPVKAEKT